MKAVGISTIHTESAAIPQHERNFNDSRSSRSHERVAEERVNHSADHRVLRVTRHGITGQHNNDTRDNVPLGPAVALPAQPDTQQTSAPPDNSHGGVLQVVMHPRASPAVLSESVDTSPRGDNERVEELLAAAGAAQPILTNKEEEGQQDPVGDESASHDEMRQTLAHVVIPTEAQGSDSTKEHLSPADNRHCLSEYSMQNDNKPTDPAVDPLGQV